MKIEKNELTRVIRMLKKTVPSKPLLPVLSGVLVKDGDIIANNNVIAVKVPVAAAKGESFIIPAAAFEFIGSLPSGEIEIVAQNKGKHNSITINSGKIINRYYTSDPDSFPVPNDKFESDTMCVIDSETLIKSIKRVSFAISPSESSMIMNSLYMKANDGILNVVAMDGRVLAWDKIDFNDGSFELLIPRESVDCMLAMNLDGNITINHNNNSAIFTTGKCVIYTRLTDGKYYNYEPLFEKPLSVKILVDKQSLLATMTRSKLVTKEKQPARIEIKDSEITVSVKGELAEYSETVNLKEEIEQNIVIGIDPRFMVDSLEKYEDDDIMIDLENGNMPIVIHHKNDQFKTMITPVAGVK